MTSNAIPPPDLKSVRQRVDRIAAAIARIRNGEHDSVTLHQTQEEVDALINELDRVELGALEKRKFSGVLRQALRILGYELLKIWCDIDFYPHAFFEAGNLDVYPRRYTRHCRALAA